MYLSGQSWHLSGAHISAVPNHQVGRATPVTFRSKVAMMGRFGLELDLGKLDEETLDTLSKENRVIFLRRYWFGDSV